MQPHLWGKTWPLGKEQQHGWVAIHHASASSPQGRIGQSNTLSLFVSYDCHLREYPHQPLNWLQEALWRDARLSISKKTQRSVSPKSQDLFQSASPEDVSVIRPPWILNIVKEKLETTVLVSVTTCSVFPQCPPPHGMFSGSPVMWCMDVWETKSRTAWTGLDT